MIMAETAACGNLDQLKEMVDNLMTFVRQAAVEGAAVHKVESEIWQRMLAMGRQAMEAFLQMQGDGDVGATIETPDGKELKRLPEQHQRTYHSISGRFRFRDTSMVRGKDNGLTLCRWTPDWSCQRTTIRTCFRIGQERFVSNMLLRGQLGHWKLFWGYRFQSTLWKG